MQSCNESVLSSHQQVVRDLMESAYRLVHCYSDEFIRSLDCSSFISGLESSDPIVKWSVSVSVVFSVVYLLFM